MQLYEQSIWIGQTVAARDGEVGIVDDIIPRHSIVVRHNWFDSETFEVPFEMVNRVDDEVVYLNVQSNAFTPATPKTLVAQARA